MSSLISVYHHHLIPGSPLVFGPGTWWIIHLTSYHCDTKEKIPDFLKFIHAVVSNIPCPTCRRNAIEYITNNDGSEYRHKVYNGKHVGMFLWMVNFHNDVNRRNNKDILKVNGLYSAYSTPNIQSKYIPDNPLIIGPGIWWVIHLLSYIAETDTTKFSKFIKMVIKSLPCLTCKNNAIKYISKNDSQKYLNIEHDNRNVGMYVWMSDFHNSVNEKNNLKLVPWKEGYSVYKHAYKVHTFYSLNIVHNNMKLQNITHNLRKTINSDELYAYNKKCKNPNCPH